jgi:hypothetical protein
MSVVNGILGQLEVSLVGEKSLSVCTCKIARAVGYNINIFLSKSPTQNCQLTSIGLVNHLLGYIIGETGARRSDIQAAVRECYKLIGFTPLMILMDVQAVHITDVESCFNVVVKQPYDNTNGSKMCLFLVKLDPLPVAPKPPIVVNVVHPNVIPAVMDVPATGFAPDLPPIINAEQVAAILDLPAGGPEVPRSVNTTILF